MTSKEEVDEEYVKKLETKLKRLKEGGSRLDSTDILNQLNCSRSNQIPGGTSSTGSFFGNSFTDAALTPSYLRLKIAPQTAALSKEELIKLVKADQLNGKI